MLLASGLLLPLCILLWFWRGRKWWQRRKRLVECGDQLPGPKPLPIFGNTEFLGCSIADLFQRCEMLWGIYGKAFRVWIAGELLLVITNARDAEVILSSTKHIHKSIFYKLFHSWLGTGLLTSNGEKWHKRRKIITPTFHFKILENFLEIFQRNGDILVSKLRRHVDEAPLDITHFIDLYTQDIISESAMGVQLNAQTQEEIVSDYLDAVKRQSEIFVERIAKPWLVFDTTFQLSALGREQKKTLKILHGMTDKVIKERKELLAKDTDKITQVNFIDEIGKKRRFAFLDLLLLSAEGGNVLSDKDIREEVDTFMFEGHDTTSSVICFALYELSKNREIQEKIYEELVDIFGDEISLRIETLNELKYTEMVIKEALRMYPSVPLIGRVLEEEMKLETIDVTLPPGAQILVTPYAIHRDPEFFPNPRVFNPDNFLPDVVQGRHPFAFVPFSAGPRNCIGQKFAMYEMKSTIAKIVWNFILEPSPKFAPHVVSGLTMKSINGIEVMFKARSK